MSNTGEARPLTNQCPYCGDAMAVTRMACGGCGVAVEARAGFPEQRLANLPTEHQRFIEMFVLAGGNLKLIAEQTGVSYPTVRSRLDKIIDALRSEIAKTQRVRGSVLDALQSADRTKPTADEAGQLIKGI